MPTTIFSQHGASTLVGYTERVRRSKTNGHGLWVQQEADTKNWFYGPVTTSTAWPASSADPSGVAVSLAGSYMTRGSGLVVVESMLLITGVGGHYILGHEGNRPWTSRLKTTWINVSSDEPRRVTGHLPLTLAIEVHFVGSPTSEITFHGHQVFLHKPD